jgi:N-ethylmaleimide reductase
MSASDVDPAKRDAQRSQATVAPRPMTRDEIHKTVADCGQAARNAIEAGFEACKSWQTSSTIAQFFNKTTNRRTDEYGGSIENRARSFFEILETVLEHLPANRVGAKTGPMNVDGAFVANDETLPTSEYVIGRLNDYKLSHLLLMGATTDFSDTPLAALAGDGIFRHFRALYRGPLIANTGIDRERANRLIEDGLADMVAFGRPYIANPRPAGALRLRSAAGRTRLEYSLCLRSRRLHRLSGARSGRRLNAINP